MNADHWTVQDGQLDEGEVVHYGAPHKDAAETELFPGSILRRLNTIESDYPKDDLRYESFPSARWCVIVRE